MSRRYRSAHSSPRFKFSHVGTSFRSTAKRSATSASRKVSHCHSQPDSARDENELVERVCVFVPVSADARITLLFIELNTFEQTDRTAEESKSR